MAINSGYLETLLTGLKEPQILSKLGQPAVIGEIAAGILLGPSIMGLVMPDFSDFIFPVESLKGLQYLSQIGLILFMFIVGLELDLSELKGEAKTIIVISSASIILPFISGCCIAYYIYTLFKPENYTFFSFSIFMGISFSITAFPVLARIIFEKKMQRTKVGYLSLSCAAINDCAAWFLLSVILAYIKADNYYDAFIRLGCIILFLLFMLFFVKPILHKIYHRIEKYFTVIILSTVLFSSILTELMGIHALFGAFITGIIISDRKFDSSELVKKIHDVSIILFLPIFFALSGLRTSIGLLNSGNLWVIFIIILFVAIFGKMLSATLASKYSGLGWYDSISIGVLMNTRGLIELIILNIGYDLGIIKPALFTILVLMAITTTFITGPLLDFFQNRKKIALKQKKQFL